MSNIQTQAIASITDSTPYVAQIVYRNADKLFVIRFDRKALNSFASNNGIGQALFKAYKRYLLRIAVNYDRAR